MRYIDTLPHEKAICIAAYLWKGCFQSTNDVWITICSGLLHEIPTEWLRLHIMEILDSATVDWNDDFEFYNLCAAFYHVPEILEQILAYAERKNPENHAAEWISDVREMAGTQTRYRKMLQNYERILELEANV